MSQIKWDVYKLHYIYDNAQQFPNMYLVKGNNMFNALRKPPQDYKYTCMYMFIYIQIHCLYEKQETKTFGIYKTVNRKQNIYKVTNNLCIQIQEKNWRKMFFFPFSFLIIYKYIHILTYNILIFSYYYYI